MTHPEFFWADRYIQGTHKGATMIGAVGKNLKMSPEALKMHALSDHVCS